MLTLSEHQPSLKIVADQVGGPTPAHDIAASCMQIVEHLIEDPSKSGTYHLAVCQTFLGLSLHERFFLKRVDP